MNAQKGRAISAGRAQNGIFLRSLYACTYGGSGLGGGGGAGAGAGLVAGARVAGAAEDAPAGSTAPPAVSGAAVPGVASPAASRRARDRARRCSGTSVMERGPHLAAHFRRDK